jgi:heme a synthase
VIVNTNRGLHRFAVLVAVCTLILVFVGGLVTSTGSGLSVPDWPLSFGKLFPKMTGGVAYEHGHRMAATLVGILTLILAAWLWRREPRKSVRQLGFLAVLAVVAQGVLGGMTVLFRLPTVLSVAHAAVAEIFLCLTVAIAASTSPGAREPRRQVEDYGAVSLRALGIITTAAIYLQILLGALMRHTAAALSIPDFPLSYGRLIPPFFNAQIFFNYAHRISGLIVIFLVLWLSGRVLKMPRHETSLRTPGLILLASLVVQVVLGAITIWSGRAPLPTTLHVVCGALTLALSLLVTINAFRTFLPWPVSRQGQAAAA